MGCCGSSPRYTTRVTQGGETETVTHDGRPVKYRVTFHDGSKSVFDTWQQADAAIAMAGTGSWEPFDPGNNS
ncbi:hypothetical protein [Streptomyces sp. NBC_01304]|uniref:hypothetical protein n=1 Tax=Streptomyces sp. NBC_01304 TaxID=2903818 RepID=UPI002E128172|nr:hypothetical protein OG430_44805 [Streptomyces sp. NBC_01304]